MKAKGPREKIALRRELRRKGYSLRERRELIREYEELDPEDLEDFVKAADEKLGN